jgi:hypothetical protein
VHILRGYGALAVAVLEDLDIHSVLSNLLLLFLDAACSPETLREVLIDGGEHLITSRTP